MERKKILLHRFMSIEKLIDMLENKHLVLINPQKWIDPLEHIISEVKFKKGNKLSHIEYLDNVYGICFTKAPESNLMWDSYTPSGSGVRVTFDRKILISEIMKGVENKDNLHHKYVSYKKYESIMSKLKDDKILIDHYKNPNNILIQYLFNKRLAYRYEEEYRIFYDANDDFYEYFETFSIKINPKKLIEKIYFNPKMAYYDCDAISKYLVLKGIDKGKMNRSILYSKKLARTIKL